jgi:hypothetical protein
MLARPGQLCRAHWTPASSLAYLYVSMTCVVPRRNFILSHWTPRYIASWSYVTSPRSWALQGHGLCPNLNRVSLSYYSIRYLLCYGRLWIQQFLKPKWKSVREWKGHLFQAAFFLSSRVMQAAAQILSATCLTSPILLKSGHAYKRACHLG